MPEQSVSTTGKATVMMRPLDCKAISVACMRDQNEQMAYLTHLRRISAEWCQKAVKVCWEAKQKAIRETERPAAAAAYQKAKAYYASQELKP